MMPDLADGIVAPPSGPKPVTRWLETRLPFGFERVLHHCLERPVTDDRYSQGALLAICLGDVHPPGRFSLPRFDPGEFFDQGRPALWSQGREAIYTGSPFALVDLSHAANAYEAIRFGL
jgi:hypothetical protein